MCFSMWHLHQLSFLVSGPEAEYLVDLIVLVLLSGIIYDEMIQSLYLNNPIIALSILMPHCLVLTQ